MSEWNEFAYSEFIQEPGQWSCIILEACHFGQERICDWFYFRYGNLYLISIPLKFKKKIILVWCLNWSTESFRIWHILFAVTNTYWKPFGCDLFISCRNDQGCYISFGWLALTEKHIISTRVVCFGIPSFQTAESNMGCLPRVFICACPVLKACELHY